MFDFIHNNKKLVQIILAVLFLPFIFFGVDSYFQGADRSDSIATVGGQEITQPEFTRALQERQNDLRRIAGNRVDPSLLDSPELRVALLENMIRQRLLVTQALRNRLLVSDQQLQEVISEQPGFQEDGKFSHARYEDLLRRLNLTQVGFENSLRRDIMVERLSDAYRSTAIVPTVVAERLLRITAQQREVSQSAISPDRFIAQVRIEEAAARLYYDANKSAFQVPEQARLEFVVLPLDTLAAQSEVSAEEIKQHYEQNPQQYSKGEERQASHILIEVDPKADAKQRQAAREKAEQLLKEAKKSPASFADLARKHSQDPPSAAKGGDLGYFPRGTMPKPVDDVVFNMKAGEIAGPVESQYGYHILRLAAVKGRGFEDAKKQIELDLKRQKAAKRFSEMGEELRDIVFTQGDSLKPAAEKLKLTLQTSDWVSRGGSGHKLLDNPRLQQAVFSDEVVQNKRNTEVIDVGDNTLVAARILEYKPASVRPLEEVKADIVKRLTRQQAAQLAVKEGRETLARLKQGGEVPAITWSTAKTVSRESPEGFPGPVLTEAFRADTGKLPAYAGVESPDGGFVLLRISRVIETESGDVAKRKTVSEELRRLLGQEQLNAYIASLKLKTEIKVKQDQLQKRQE